jgi:excinuclease ABC subunit C
MQEVVYRRYSGLLSKKEALPQLIIVDGGKGQLSCALQSLKKLQLENTISIIGIAKKLETIFSPFDNIPLYLDKRSESLKLIQRLRDEAHRFSLNHHRKKRTNKSLSSSLDNIDGIGVKTKELLLENFHSVKNIKNAKKHDLDFLIGKNKSNKIMLFYKKHK